MNPGHIGIQRLCDAGFNMQRIRAGAVTRHPAIPVHQRVRGSESATTSKPMARL